MIIHRFTSVVFGLLAVLLTAPVALSQALGTTASFRIMVQPQVEIFSVIDYLGRGKRDLSIESDYKTAVEKQFRQYAQHPAVKYWQHLQKKYNLLPGEAGSWFAVSDGRFLAAEVPAGLDARKMTHAEWIELEKQVNSFTTASGFLSFHNSNKTMYAQWQKSLQPQTEKRDYFNKILAFTGTYKNFILHPDALDAWGSYHVPDYRQVHDDALLVWGFCKSKNSGPDKPPFFADSAMLNNTLWHEMAHTFINPLVRAHAAELKKLPATDKVRKNASRYYELTREVAVSELLVRGMVASLVRHEFGNAAAEREIDRQLKTFGYDIAKTEQLFTEVYQKNRSQYPKLASFFPVLLAQFKAQP